MIDDDRTYFRYRAVVETERAVRSTEPSAMQAHYALAEAYFEKLRSIGDDLQQRA